MSPKPVKDTAKPLIVFVEEEPVLADITAFRLELLGYRVRTYSNAEAALAAVFEETPDMMLIDLDLTGTSGLQLMERLSSNEATNAIPVMAISADAELDLVQQAFEAGAADYLVVPYNPEILEEKVETLVGRVGARV